MCHQSPFPLPRGHLDKLHFPIASVVKYSHETEFWPNECVCKWKELLPGLARPMGTSQLSSLPSCWLDGEDPNACWGRSMKLWMGMRKGVCHGTTYTALPRIGKLTHHGRQLRFGDFFVTAASATNSREAKKHRCWRRSLKGALAPFPSTCVHTHTHTHTHTHHPSREGMID